MIQNHNNFLPQTKKCVTKSRQNFVQNQEPCQDFKIMGAMEPGYEGMMVKYVWIPFIRYSFFCKEFKKHVRCKQMGLQRFHEFVFSEIQPCSAVN